MREYESLAENSVQDHFITSSEKLHTWHMHYNKINKHFRLHCPKIGQISRALQSILEHPKDRSMREYDDGMVMYLVLQDPHFRSQQWVKREREGDRQTDRDRERQRETERGMCLEW